MEFNPLDKLPSASPPLPPPPAPPQTETELSSFQIKFALVVLLATVFNICLWVDARYRITIEPRSAAPAPVRYNNISPYDRPSLAPGTGEELKKMPGIVVPQSPTIQPNSDP